jgi:hypothetical protein
MKTALQIALRKIAPSLSIATDWSHDEDFRDIRKDCEGMDDEDPADWQAWQSEVRATTIHEGEELSGSAYLGGTWEKAGDVPEESNPDISGYENQMTVEALEELAKKLPDDSTDQAEISAAIAHIKTLN